MASSKMDGLTIRYFRNSDALQVRELFTLCMVIGPGSGRATALQRQLYRPSTFVLYTLTVVGLALVIKSPERRILGASLVTGMATLFFGHRSLITRIFMKYGQRESKSEDLANTAGHYKLQPIRPDAEELVPSGPSAFWVAEKECSDKGGRAIIGCIGLDCQRKEGTLHGELRRMMVSPEYRRMGISASLIETLIAHARKNGVPSISLSTSHLQDPARRLYQKFGWVEQSRIWKKAGIFGGWILSFKLDLTGAKGSTL